MAPSAICSLLVFLAIAPQAASEGFLRSVNATQALSGAVGDFEMDGSIQAGEATDSDSAEAQDSYDKTVHQGLGGSTGTEGSEKETQAAADAAESMADSTEPATEVIGDFDDDKVTDEPSTGGTPKTSSTQSPADEQNWESETPLEDKIGSQFDSLIQSEHDDDSEATDSDAQESSGEDNSSQGKEDSSASEEAPAAPEEGSQSEEEAQEGSDIAMYAGGHLQADSPAETSGSEEGSDMAMYASRSSSQSQSDQVAEDGQHEQSSGGGSGQSQSDHALYGGQEQDESGGSGDHSQADQDANGGDELSQSDMALYGGSSQEDSEAASALIQTLRRHAALFGSGDEDSEELDADDASLAEADDEEGEGLNEESTDEDMDGESSDEADSENSQAADDAEEEEESGAGDEGESEEAETESEEMSDESEEEMNEDEN